MSEALPTCANHPKQETRVACSSCGKPICPACMRPAPVGQKCPECASVPRRARAFGKPQHYLRAVGAGAAVAVVGGVVLAQLLIQIRFGTLILSGILGFLIGRTVLWGAQRQRQRPFPHIAAVLAVISVAIALVRGYGVLLPPSIWLLLAYLAAGYFAVRGVQS